VLDLDKAATQLGAGTDERAYKFPDSDVKVVFTLKYSAKQIEVSTLFSRVVNKIESKPKGKSKEKGKANVKAVEKEEILIPATLSPWNIDLPMQADTTQLLRAGEPDGVIPAFELACKLERRRIDNDCPECR
ncbi:MAG: hypothetical protein HY074_17225, partial [Deltaproteobacteria bacterium]|nr:hypothetical protein [Deltaproteobacteria bacterium]